MTTKPPAPTSMPYRVDYSWLEPPTAPPPPAPPAPLPTMLPVARARPVPTRPAPAVRPHPLQWLFLLGAGIVLFGALVFFSLFWLVLNWNTVPPARKTLLASATAVAEGRWTVAEPGCATLLQDPPGEAAYSETLAHTYYGCGLHLVGPQTPNVPTALTYFQAANTLLPGHAEIAHQIDLAQRYMVAQRTLHKPDLGGYIDQLEWYTKQAEFTSQPYADVPQLLYGAYLDSGKGYLQVRVCDAARQRFQQATGLNFVDPIEARALLDETLRTCK